MENSRNNVKLVELNIGGQFYTTTVATLTKYSASSLARSVNVYLERKAIQKDNQSKLFIDRDGTIFRYILEYLRRSNPDKDWITNMIPPSEIFRLRSEAQFYGLTGLVAEVRKPPPSQRKIHFFAS